MYSCMVICGAGVLMIKYGIIQIQYKEIHIPMDIYLARTKKHKQIHASTHVSPIHTYNKRMVKMYRVYS